MSGHGNFSAIDGVRPTLPTIQQPGEDIGVSLKGKAYVGSRILHLTEGYFRRNIMSAIAKPGWFD